MLRICNSPRPLSRVSSDKWVVIFERRINPKTFSCPDKEIIRSMSKEAKTASKFKAGSRGICGRQGMSAVDMLSAAF